MDFGEGVLVTVSDRVYKTKKHFDPKQVVAAAHKIASDALAHGKPTDSLTLSQPQYKRFLGVS